MNLFCYLLKKKHLETSKRSKSKKSMESSVYQMRPGAADRTHCPPPGTGKEGGKKETHPSSCSGGMNFLLSPAALSRMLQGPSPCHLCPPCVASPAGKDQRQSWVQRMGGRSVPPHWMALMAVFWSGIFTFPWGNSAYARWAAEQQERVEDPCWWVWCKDESSGGREEKGGRENGCTERSEPILIILFTYSVRSETCSKTCSPNNVRCQE